MFEDKRNIYAKVRHGDKAAIAADLRDIFRTGQRDYTIEMAWAKWPDILPDHEVLPFSFQGSPAFFPNILTSVPQPE